MKSSVNITQENGFFYLEFTGEIEKSDLIRAYSNLLAHEGFNKESSTSWDFSHCSLILSYVDIKEIAEKVVASSSQRSSESRSAFIVNEEGNRALLETYLTKTARYPTEFCLFDNISDAKSWLASD
ncbi:MAG: hypothetical protein OQJ89_03845 [Kangiellaceae bacterium]|nr:hypothetical protein [Kangiellaceae bacterium]MCW8998738.1 hypothetical protein [Kangiellaceae bacterium]MCW9016072.1 hypothetical protein [Kangiellaceae bacterium]